MLIFRNIIFMWRICFDTKEKPPRHDIKFLRVRTKKNFEVKLKYQQLYQTVIHLNLFHVW